MIKYSLVGFDGSESSKRAFEFAMNLARLSGGRVRVVSVLQVTEGGIDASAMLIADGSTDRTHALLKDLIAMAPDAEQMVDVDVIYGSPGDVLLAQVREHAVDHVVIGHTERGALARWLIGSVSNDVLARAHVPVTVVR
jgi:nucleotide-binding universal stress UspA family protein